jgi:hypothetical protein
MKEILLAALLVAGSASLAVAQEHGKESEKCKERTFNENEFDAFMKYMKDCEVPCDPVIQMCGEEHHHGHGPHAAEAEEDRKREINEKWRRAQRGEYLRDIRPPPPRPRIR